MMVFETRSMSTAAWLVAVTLAGLVLVASPAQAKIPPFIVEVEPERPVAGEVTTIWVEFDAAFPVGELEGLMTLRKADGGDDAGIPLTLVGVGLTGAKTGVVIPEPGDWEIVVFPDRTGWAVEAPPPGYPDVIPLQVASPGLAWPGEGLAGAGLALLAGLVFFGRRLLRGRPLLTR